MEALLKVNDQPVADSAELLKHIAQNDNEMSYLGHGPIVWCPRWDDMEWFDTTASCLINYRGWPVHHAIESYGQVGGLLNMVFNRDPMIHSHQNMLQCGLPHELKQQIAAELWGGEDALDAEKDYKPLISLLESSRLVLRTAKNMK